MRCAAVTSLANHGDSNNRNCCEKWTLTHSYVALVKVWDVVKTVDFVDTFEASILNHRFSTTWPFFGRLEQQSDTLALRDLIQVLLNNFSAGQKASHMPVMATHMSVVRLRPVRQIFGIFRDREAIHVSSQSDHIDSLLFASFGPSTLKINNKTSYGALLDSFIFNTKTFQRVDQSLLCPELIKASFWMRVQLLPYGDNVVDVPSRFVHRLFMLLKVTCEFCLSSSSEA